ncbi:MAG: hypothetical protein AAB621_03510 [Patescibacteria group bacterium]
MKKNKVTTEQLLKAVKQGFTETREYTDKKTEDLARMVQNGFEEVKGEMHRRFDKIEDWQRLAGGRLDAIEMELIDIKKKLAGIVDHHEFELLKERVKDLEIRLASIKRK